MGDIEVVAPNFKQRLSGVTSTVVQLLPVQAQRIGIAALGPGLPQDLPKMRVSQMSALFRAPQNRPFRIWHARRNNEMLAGIILRDVLRAPLKLVFTSAAQRHHTAWTRWMLRRMDAVIATNDRSASYLQVPHTVIRHGIDLDKFHLPRSENDSLAAAGLPGRRAIGCFGRIRKQKGTDLFVDAMIVLLPQHPDWTAVIGGRVTAQHKSFVNGLKSRIEAAGLSHRIVFLGEVPDITVWYRRIDLFVAPSRHEGFGLTPLEAMASGTAVVTSDAGAYPDLVASDETGLIVPAGDGQALTAAIRRYMSDAVLLERHGAAAYNRAVRLFPLRGESDAIVEIYEQLWAQAPGAS